jgi:predicted RNA-binding Zn ribbon-like protein
MSRYLFIANDRALDFVNTAFAGGDTVPDVAAFVGWLEAGGMLTADEARAALVRAVGPEQERTIARVHAFRSAMRRMVGACVAGRAPAADDLAVTNAHLRRAPIHDELVAVDGGVASVRRVATDVPEALLYFVAEAARKLFTRKDVGAIRRCANESCTHYFYDASKNGTRRWCRMAGCGNREKVAALRSRRRAG